MSYPADLFDIPCGPGDEKCNTIHPRTGNHLEGGMDEPNHHCGWHYAVNDVEEALYASVSNLERMNVGNAKEWIVKAQRYFQRDKNDG